MGQVDEFVGSITHRRYYPNNFYTGVLNLDDATGDTTNELIDQGW